MTYVGIGKEICFRTGQAGLRAGPGGSVGLFAGADKKLVGFKSKVRH